MTSHTFPDGVAEPPSEIDVALSAYLQWLDTVCPSIGIKANAHLGTQLLAVAAKLRTHGRTQECPSMGELLVAHAHLLETVFAQEIKLLREGRVVGDPGDAVRAAVHAQRQMVVAYRNARRGDAGQFMPQRGHGSGTSGNGPTGTV